MEPLEIPKPKQLTKEEVDADFANVKAFVESGGEAEMSKALFSDLYDLYLECGEIPVGTAKAREGDPYEWIYQRFLKHLQE